MKQRSYNWEMCNQKGRLLLLKDVPGNVKGWVGVWSEVVEAEKVREKGLISDYE